MSGREQLEEVPPVAGGKMSLDRKIEPPKSQSEVGAVWGGGCGRGDLESKVWFGSNPLSPTAGLIILIMVMLLCFEILIIRNTGALLWVNPAESLAEQHNGRTSQANWGGL